MVYPSPDKADDRAAHQVPDPQGGGHVTSSTVYNLP